MEVLIYGNNRDRMVKVKQILEDLVDKVWTVYSATGNVGSISDYEDTNIQAVIFVGMCPKEELAIIQTIGLKAFIILPPTEQIDATNVRLSEIKKINEQEKLTNELKSFFKEAA